MGNVRVNKAKKFNGRSYVGTDALDALITSISLSGNTLTLIGNEATTEGDGMTAKAIDLSGLVSVIANGSAYISVSNNEINPTTLNTFLGTASASKIVTTDANSHLEYENAKVTAIGNSPADTNIPTEKAVKDYVDGKAITVKPGAGIVVITSDAGDTSVSTLNPKIAADIDSATIVWSGTGDTAKLAAGLTIKKLDTATTGYAASYQLVDASQTAIGATIDIVKDQFIKSAAFGWADTSDSNPSSWSSTKPASGTVYPCIKIEVWTNVDGDASSSDTTATTIYVPLNDVFTEYTARNGVTITDDSIIEGVVDSTSQKVYATKGTQADVFTVSSDGFKVANIQAAIDLAVNDEHAKASAAIAAIDADVEAFETSVNTAIGGVVSDVNTAITTTVTNVNTQVEAFETSVNTNVAAFKTSVNDAITSSVTNVNTALSTTVGNVNTQVGAAVADVNDKVGSAVDDVNDKVGSAVDDVNAQVKAVVSAVQGDIDTTVGNVNTAVGSAVADVNDKVGSAVTKAVELFETTTAVSKDGNGIVTVTGVAGNIIAVFGVNGDQIYPDIVKSGSGVNATNTLTADYGSATADASWTILHTQAITYSNAVYSNATVAKTASYSDASYDTASYGTASYTGATAGSATAVATAAYADVDYTAANASTVASASTAAYASGNAIADLDYKRA